MAKKVKRQVKVAVSQPLVEPVVVERIVEKVVAQKPSITGAIIATFLLVVAGVALFFSGRLTTQLELQDGLNVAYSHVQKAAYSHFQYGHSVGKREGYEVGYSLGVDKVTNRAKRLLR